MTRHPREFIIGATVGSVLGGIGALLLAPKEGVKIRKDICNLYDDVSEKTHCASQRGKAFAKNIGDHTCDWTDKAHCAIEDITKYIKSWTSEEDSMDEEATRDLLIGGLVGGIIGAAAGLLLAPKAGEDLREDIVDTYHDVSERTHDMAHDLAKKGRSFAKTARKQSSHWLDFAKHAVEDLTEGVQGGGENLLEHAKQLANNRRVSEALDWASLGYRLWKGMKKHKRR